MKVLVIACSLDPNSRSAVLCASAAESLAQRGAKVEVLDLREIPLPMCDGAEAYGDDALPGLVRSIAEADAVLLGVPIYNYDVNAAAKNLIELTGRAAWTNQTVGFLCAAGGRGSYMSAMPLANSLMLDFRSVIVPRFVYATGDDFEGDQIQPGIAERIGLLADETLRLAGVMKPTNPV